MAQINLRKTNALQNPTTGTAAIGVKENNELFIVDENGNELPMAFRNIPVLTEYPQTNAEKAGQRFIYKGNEWRYMTQSEIDSTGWTGLVDIGYPAPINKNLNPFIAFDFDSYIQIAYLGSLMFANILYTNATGIVDIRGLGSKVNFLQRITMTLDNGTITDVKGFELLKSLEDEGTGLALLISSSGAPVNISAELLNDIFTALPSTSKTATISISNTTGASTCDPTIATSKGYTVIT